MSKVESGLMTIEASANTITYSFNKNPKKVYLIKGVSGTDIKSLQLARYLGFSSSCTVQVLSKKYEQHHYDISGPKPRQVKASSSWAQAMQSSAVKLVPRVP